MDIIIHLCFR